MYTMEVLAEKADRTETRLAGHGTRLTAVETGVITIRADIKASRNATVTVLSLIGFIVVAVQLILHVVG